MFNNSQQALDFVHEYSKQLCLALPQVEEVSTADDLLLRVRAVEGHTFNISLQPLVDQMREIPGEAVEDELLYYLCKQVNESLGYKNIWPTDISVIFPLIQNTPFIHGLTDQQSDEIIYRGFEGDLWICYGLCRENQLHYLTHEQLKYTLNVAAEDLHSLALENLQRVQDQNAKIDRLNEDVWQLSHSIRYGDDASVILLGGVWQSIIENFDMQKIVLTMPRADCVLFCDAGNEASVNHLRQMTDEFYQKADEPLSRFLFWWNPDDTVWQTTPWISLIERLEMCPSISLPQI